MGVFIVAPEVNAITWNTHEQLDRLFLDLKEKYIRTYGNQYMIESYNNKNLMRLFHRKCEENGIVHDNEQIFNYLHFFEESNDSKQLSIWDWGAG